MGLAKRKQEGLDLQIADVLSELANSRRLPKTAIRAALEQPDVFAPEFLRILHDCASGVPLGEDERCSVFFIVHVLGELRETGAFPYLIRLLRSDSDLHDYDLQEAVTETFTRILISTFDGDIALLHETIADQQADDFARSVALSAWVYQVLRGVVEKEEAFRYLSSFSRNVVADSGSYLWVAWTDAIADLGYKELCTQVEWAFQDGRISDGFMLKVLDLEDFYERLDLSLNCADREEWMRGHGYVPFEDTVGTLSKWDFSSPETYHSLNQILLSARNPHRDVGRNDPCPCGSGRKYKKCCLQ